MAEEEEGEQVGLRVLCLCSPGVWAREAYIIITETLGSDGGWGREKAYACSLPVLGMLDVLVLRVLSRFLSRFLPRFKKP